MKLSAICTEDAHPAMYIPSGIRSTPSWSTDRNITVSFIIGQAQAAEYA